MRVTVRLLGSFRILPAEGTAEPGTCSLSLGDGATVAELLAELPIPGASACTVFVNGRHAERSQVLRDGDEVSAFPAVGGG